MKISSKSLLLVSFLALILLSPLQAQTAPAAAPLSAATPAPAGQAPDEMTRKITELVHAGKYAEAQQFTAGLLIAYPDDQRLIKAKALIDQLIAHPSSTSAVPANSQPAQPAANANGPQLTGMDKVDYNALIVLARQAQQTSDLEEQNKLVRQFMEQSAPFLQKHPEQMLLWQLRAASAMSLNEPMAGYEAGEKLLAAGAADSIDPAMQQLLGQLRNKGWLDKQSAEKHAKYDKYDWILGTWGVSAKWIDTYARDREQFVTSDSGIEGYLIGENGVKNAQPDFKVTFLDSGELKWEYFLPPTDTGEMYVFRYLGSGILVIKLMVGRKSDPNGYFGSNHHFDSGLLYSTKASNQQFYPYGWQPVRSAEFDKDKRTLKIVVDAQEADPNPHHSFIKDKPVTLLFSKSGSAQEEQVQPQ
jgi:hypothetical protein